MYISYRWLQRYVDLPDDLSMEKLSHDLTMRTVEVEGVEDLSEKYDRTIVAQITEVKEHPNADKLRICMVDIGDEKDVQIVCGGSNLEVGQWVIVTLPGAKAIWHGEGEPVVISETELRGETSYGMICGAEELDLDEIFPVKEAHEVVDLGAYGFSDQDLKAGQEISEALGLDDFIIEIDNKSLTHRPDLWGHYGIAREIAAFYQLPLKDLKMKELGNNLENYPVEITNSDRCKRYVAVEYEKLDNRKSPLWLQIDLMNVGVRPINAIVDITNYVMLAVGNPTHAYDKDHIKGGIVVREANEGEKLTLLDGKELTLSNRNTVISDHEKPVGLAGIMGGHDDSISESTDSIIFEIANFDAQNIRKTSQEFDVRTEASTRFEKGIDTQRADLALYHMNYIIHELFPDIKTIAFQDNYPVKTEMNQIQVSLDWLNRRLGTEVRREEVVSVLKPLGFDILNYEDPLLVLEVPTWRSTGDVEMIDDVLEEVARMIGYENFELLAPQITLTQAINQKEESLDRRIREYLAFSCGFQEVFTYPWVDDAFVEASQIDTENMLSLAEPPAPDQNKLRNSLLPGQLEVIVKNIRYFDDFRIFEVAQVFEKGESRPSIEEEVLPIQKKELAGSIVGTNPVDLFFAVKGVLEALPRYCQIPEFEFRQVDQPVWADHKAWLEIYVENEKIGEFALVSTVSKMKAGIKHHDACIFRLDMEALKPFDSRSNEYEVLPLYPHVYQDVTVTVGDETTWEEVKDLVEPYVESVDFVDEYHSDKLGKDKKSLTLRVEIASDEGTLTNEEIDEVMKKVLDALKTIGTTLRDL